MRRPGNAGQSPRGEGLFVRRYSILLLVTGLAFLALPMVAGAQTERGGDGRYGHLNPGGPADYREEVPLNVVFVGYERDDVDEGGVPGRAAAVLPAGQRHPSTYREEPDTLGIEYTYDYEVVYAGHRYEDRFFAELSALATPQPLTIYQQA
jgi:hypothetical protein